MIKDNSNSDTAIENQLYAMIKTMKRNKVTKQVVKMKFCSSVHVFGGGWGGKDSKELFSYGVNKNGTIKQLISELNDKLKAKRFP